MRNRKAFAFFCFVLFTSCVFNKSYAQQEPQFTMFWNIYSIQNPAATGIFKKHYASVEGRNQWVGFPGSPKTITAFYDTKIASINSGIGVNYYIDLLGRTHRQNLKLNYSYHFKLAEGKILSAGLSSGILRNTTRHNYFGNYDPAIPTSKYSDNRFDIGVGAMYKSPRILLGVGITHLNETKSVSKYVTQNVKHLFVNGSYNISLNSKLELRPTFYYKTDFSSGVIDVNLLATFKKIYWGGVSYRYAGTMAIMTGVDISKIVRIGYSYDYAISPSSISNGSHEFVLALMLD